MLGLLVMANHYLFLGPASQRHGSAGRSSTIPAEPCLGPHEVSTSSSLRRATEIRKERPRVPRFQCASTGAAFVPESGRADLRAGSFSRAGLVSSVSHAVSR